MDLLTKTLTDLYGPHITIRGACCRAMELKPITHPRYRCGGCGQTVILKERGHLELSLTVAE